MNQKSNVFQRMIDRGCKRACENEELDNHLILCEEFIKTVKEIQGTDLIPYLVDAHCSGDDGCYNMTFKFPIVDSNELKNLQ